MSEAEKSVIGSVLLTNGKCLDDLNLKADDFFEYKLGEIYATMLQMKAEGLGIDVITVGQRIPKYSADLHEYTSFTPTAANVDYYAQVVADASTRRRLVSASHNIIQATEDNGPDSLVEFARKAIDDALGARVASVSFMQEDIFETIDLLGKKAPVFESPWPWLDKVIGGFRPGALYIVAARPAVGKTVIGLQIAEKLSHVGAVAFNSLEMSKSELHKRLIASVCEIDMEELAAHSLSMVSDTRLAKNREKLRLPISFDDRAGISVADIRLHARSVARKKPLSGIVVDYIGLIGDKTGKDRSRYEAVTEVSQQLKVMARDLNVPVIALAQLNRNVEGRKDGKPMMADLRDSGSLEQDADVVILLHREQNKINLDVAKNRHGQTGLVSLKFEGEYSRANQ